MLDIRKELENGELRFVLGGRLDAETSPLLKDEVLESLQGMKKVVFDTSTLEYVSSAGLRVFLSTVKSMGKPGSVAIVGARPEVREVLVVTGLADFITVE